MRSVMQHNFSSLPDIKLSRSVFNRSHGYKTTFDSGFLIPFLSEEIIPGDTINLNSTFFGRLATPLTPFMDNLVLDYFYFFVPNRLLWENWQKFYGEQENPGDSTDFLVPIMDKTKAPLSTTGYTEGSLSDYFGLPTKVAGFEHISLYHRAYNLIWNEWFRDQNLQNSVDVPKGDGPDDPADFVLLKRGKRKDYFTSALPWPQKPFAGITDVTLPLGTSATVMTSASPLRSGSGSPLRVKTTAGNVPSAYTWGNNSSGVGILTTTAPSGTISDFYPSNLYADLSNATAATINQLRQAFQIQRLLEQQARGGTRYIERLRVEFQVVSPDARLQRPELLSVGTTPINVHPIANTNGQVAANSPTGSKIYQGDLSASASLYGNASCVHSFVEHGILLGLLSVRADLTYSQGLDRKWSRQTAFDYFRPVLQNLGEQAILRKEIFCDGTSNDETVFGYIPRYDEYRFAKSQLTGLFRFNATGSLSTWHLSQQLNNTVALNADFIEENPPIDRVIAVPSQPQFLLDVFNNLKHIRPISLNAVPGLIDHF